MIAPRRSAVLTGALAAVGALTLATAAVALATGATHPTRSGHGGGTASRSTLGSLAAGPAGPVQDPLAANGFASPSCTTASLFAQISPQARQDCQVSGVAVAPVPLSNYAFDTNIPSGLGASFDDDVDSIIDDLLITPLWTAIVWLVHAAVVGLEWCYSIDLLAPSMLGSVAAALGSAEQIFTQPWIGLVLALGGIALAWNGIVRRRVAETLGQALLTVAMIVVGLWIIADPVGSVGEVSRLSDQAALGTVSATATGDASQGIGGLDSALGEVFDSAITGPWCYLEFGDVDWCRDPSRLDPRLAATGRELERLYSAGATCGGSAPGLVECAPGGSAEQRSYAATALALSAARTNGALFLALPAGGLARNDLASQTSLPTLYGTLCGSSDPTACTAGTAPQAEFRTAAGTWPRAGGLLLIAVGAAGMLAMLGFIALRLLGAAIAVLVYLLLAPLAVLAPALGDSGRDTFRHWLTRLVGAALAKLVYSLLLGMTLLVLRLLVSVQSLGWWTQWLLISVFWWLAFEQRHRLLAFVIHERGEPVSRLPLATRVRYGSQAVRSVARAGGFARRAALAGFSAGADIWQQARHFPAEPAAGAAGLHERSRRGQARARLAGQLDRALAIEHAARLDAARQAPVMRDELAGLRERRARLAEQQRAAERSGDRRRVASLTTRARDVERQIAAHSASLGRASTHSAPIAALLARRERFRQGRRLDRAARAYGGDRTRPHDYAPLAGLAGLTATDYSRASGAERLRARIEIERALAARYAWLRESRAAARLGLRVPGAGRVGDPVTARPASPAERRERQFASRLR